VRRAILISSLALALAACSFGTSTSSSPLGSMARVAPTLTAGPAQPPAQALRECPVTAPGRPRPPAGLPPVPYLGNGRMWVGLWPAGLVIVPPDDTGRDGFLRMKFMWWRGSSVRGVLDISGYELGFAAAVHARTPVYGVTGFNASSIFFPGEGCYRVTGSAGGAGLSFVTLVRTCSVLDELAPSLRKAYSKSWCRPG